MGILRLSSIILLTLLLLTAPSLTLAQTDATPVVQAVLFYSPTCFHCHQVITEVLAPMTETYGDQLQIIGIDTTQERGGQLYQAAIERFQISAQRRGVPTLIVGDIILVGSGEIPEQFPGIVESGLAKGGIAWPDFPEMASVFAEADAGQSEPTAQVQPTSTPPPTASPSLTPAVPSLAAENNPDSPLDEPKAPVYLAYFFDPTCLECAQVSADLEILQTQYPNLVIREYDLRQEAALNEAMCEKYGVPEAYRLMAPTVFIGDNCLSPDEITVARLQTLIENPATAQTSPPWQGLETGQVDATARIVDRFKQFGVLAVAGAGLLDGVNPCAFTTIIFFVSYLALVGRKGREILLVGAAFTLAVFLTYLIMGLGLAEVVRQIGSFALIGRLIYGLTALICLALAGLSLWDYLKIRRGQLTDIALQLPKALKQRIHHTIRTRSRMKGYITAAFVAGVLVSVFELACTGQVYLPTIVFVTGVSELRATAVAYLVLYNVMFVAPLIAVFMVTYLGTNSRQLTAKFQANAGLVKLATALLFGVLGVWLGYLVMVA